MEKWTEPDLLTTMVLGIGGCVLGMLGVLLGGTTPKRGWFLLQGALWLVAVAFGAGAAAYGMPQAAWLPPLVLAGIWASFHLFRSRAFTRAAGLVLAPVHRPRLQWGVLLVCSPILMLWWADRLLRPEDPGPVDDVRRLGLTTPPLEQDLQYQAITDRGRPIPLYTALPEPNGRSELQPDEATIFPALRIQAPVTRTSRTDPRTNCHGWVFGEGRHWLMGEEVEIILQDNGYEPVDTPQPDDVIIYRSGTEIVHSGLVRIVGVDGVVLVESKWGRLSRYVHTPEATSYGAQPTYYRSTRKGHAVRRAEAVGPAPISDMSQP